MVSSLFFIPLRIGGKATFFNKMRRMKKEMRVQMINPGSGLNIGFSLQRFIQGGRDVFFRPDCTGETLIRGPSFKIKNG
jgi:hypothetical protein